METISHFMCSLCLYSTLDKRCEEINKTTREILEVVFANQNVNVSRLQRICQVCMDKLNKAFSFKYTCVYTEEFLVPYVTSLGKVQIDLREVYHRKNRSDTTTVIADYQKVCRLCMKLVTGNSTSLVESAEYDMLQKYVPEIMVQICIDPVACETCTVSLHNFVSFTSYCLYVHEKNIMNLNEGYCGNKTADLTQEQEMKLKNESLDIKSEPIVTHYNASKSPYTCVSRQLIKHEDNMEFHHKQDLSTFSLYNLPSATITSVLNNFQYTDSQRDKKTEYDCNPSVLYDLDQRIIKYNETDKQQSQPEVYKCDHCEYKTKFRNSLVRHTSKYKTTCKDRIFRCEKCPYTTPYPNALKSHTLNHLNPSEIVLYHCEKCEYKTKYRNALKSHVLNHKLPSEIVMRKCDQCPYETKHRTALVMHMLKHKSPEEIKMYHCEFCEFKTKFKHALKPHTIKHKREAVKNS